MTGQEYSDSDVRKAWERTTQDRLNQLEELAEKAATSPEPEEVDDSPRNREELYDEMAEAREQEIADEIEAAEEAKQERIEQSLDRYWERKEAEDQEEYERSMERVTDEEEHKLLIQEIEELHPELMENPLWRQRFADAAAERLRDDPSSWDDGRLYKEVAETVSQHMKESAEDPGAEKRYDKDYTRLAILTSNELEQVEYQRQTFSPHDEHVATEEETDHLHQRLMEEFPNTFGDPIRKQEAARQVDDLMLRKGVSQISIGEYRSILQPIESSIVVEEMAQGRKPQTPQERQEAAKKRRDAGITDVDR